MKRSNIQSLQGVFICILMLNVSFLSLLQRGGYRFGYSRKLAVVYVEFGHADPCRATVFPDDRISLGYTVATLIVSGIIS